MQYTSLAGNNITYSTLLIQNYYWPGAYNAYKIGEFSSLYIGFGFRKLGTTYYPYTPLNVEKDPEGLKEYREPNPDKDPEIIESDTDKSVEEKEIADD